MKIKYNEVEILDMSSLKEQVIKNDILESEFEADMKRRVCYILEHKYERCMERLKAEWIPKLSKRGHQMLPTDNDSFAQLVFSQQDYMSREAREIESQRIKNESNKR